MLHLLVDAVDATKRADSHTHTFSVVPLYVCARTLACQTNDARAEDLPFRPTTRGDRQVVIRTTVCLAMTMAVKSTTVRQRPPSAPQPNDVSEESARYPFLR